MANILFYDTETTGLPLFKEQSEHPNQPHIVQIAAILVDDETRKTIQSIDLIIKPNGYEIPSEMTDIHGITNEYAIKNGVNGALAMDLFHNIWAVSDIRVAYNESFDARMVRIVQYKIGYTPEFLERWKLAPAECCMKMAQKVIGEKFPKLYDSYRHFFGKELENARSAMADTVACRDVYFSIKDLP